jgi:hypothetical protein
MRSLLGLLLALLLVGPACGEDLFYSGSWIDTGNPTRGPMTAKMTERADGKWNIQFDGIFQGAKFRHSVVVDRTADTVTSEGAKVNAAKYVWTGVIRDETFTGKYSSNRGHVGTWSMKRVK